MAVALFPELSLTGYAIDDLLGQDALLDAVHDGLDQLIQASTDLLPVLIVGAPLRHRARLFNTAVVIHRGEVLGVVPKLHLPNYREFYERRQFASGHGITGLQITVAGRTAPFGTDLLFAATDVEGLTVGVEICEDMFVPVPPSSGLALAGATVLANLSGSPITIGRSDTRSLLCRSPVDPLPGRLPVRGGRAGRVDHRPELGRPDQHLRERRPRWPGRPVRRGPAAHHRRRRPGPAPAGTRQAGHLRGQPPGRRRRRTAYRTVEFSLDPPDDDLGLRRPIERFPFVPADPERLAQDCFEAYNIQVDGLVQRLRAIKTERVVIGVSGGLDSTHALIVAARAMDLLGLPRTNILAFTMPGFRHRQLHQGQRLGADAGAGGRPAPSWTSGRRPGRCWPTWSIRSAAARRSTTSPSRTCRRGCAPTTCSGWPTTTTGSCWAPVTCPSWRWAGAPTASATRCRTTTSTPGCPRR